MDDEITIAVAPGDSFGPPMLPLELQDLRERISDGFIKSIDVDEGWYDILIRLQRDLVAIDPDFKVHQIKEKFGGLRFYASDSAGWSADSPFHNRIREAEEESWKVCERTGKPGVLMQKRGWYKTLDPATAPEGFEVVE